MNLCAKPNPGSVDSGGVENGVLKKGWYNLNSSHEIVILTNYGRI